MNFPGSSTTWTSANCIVRGCCVLVSFQRAFAAERSERSGSCAKTRAVRDPAEPQQKVEKPKILPRPAGAIARASIDEKSMRALIDQMVACGTRLSIAPWDDANRGPGCGRDRIVARLDEIAKASGGKLQVVVDKFEATSARTANKPAPMENVYAILPGTDEKLSKTLFIVSGHFDSRPSDDQDTKADAPGAGVVTLPA